MFAALAFCMTSSLSLSVIFFRDIVRTIDVQKIFKDFEIRGESGGKFGYVKNLIIDNCFSRLIFHIFTYLYIEHQ